MLTQAAFTVFDEKTAICCEILLQFNMPFLAAITLIFIDTRSFRNNFIMLKLFIVNIVISCAAYVIFIER